MLGKLSGMMVVVAILIALRFAFPWPSFFIIVKFTGNWGLKRANAHINVPVCCRAWKFS